MGLFMISGRHGQDILMCSWAKTLGFHGTSLQPGEYMRTGKLSVKPDEMLGGYPSNGLAAHPGKS